MLGPFQLYGLIGAPSRRLPRRRMRAPPLTFVWYPIEILSLFSNYAEDIPLSVPGAGDFAVVVGSAAHHLYILNILHQKESDIRQDYNLNFDQAQGYIRHSADIIRDIKYMAENRLNGSVSSLDMFSGVFPGKGSPPQFFPLYPESNCTLSTTYRSSLDSLSGLIQYWKENFVAAYDLNRVFFIGGDSLCMAEFGGGNASANRENVLKSLHERILKYRNAKNLDKDNNLYWISPSAAAGRRLSVCADADLYRQQAGGAAGHRTDRSAGGFRYRRQPADRRHAAG